MDQYAQTTRHNKLTLGHAFIASGLFLFFFLSILLSAVSSLPAVAFGTSTISGLSNSARNSNGVPSLSVNSQLSSAAQNKASAMVANDYFEHTAPDGTTGWDYISAAGYSFASAGENLAASNEDDNAVVDGWLNSQAHRDNLLNSTYTEVGYGIAYKGDFSGYSNVTFIVALYAKPQAAAVVAAPLAPLPTAPTQAQPVAASGQPAPSASEPEPQTEAVVSASAPSSGSTAALSKPKFSMDNKLSLGILSLSTGLSVSGIGLEGQRIARHFKTKH